MKSEHNIKRKNLKKKGKKIGAPQTRHQKAYVMNMFKPIYFYRAYNTGSAIGFSNFSLHPVILPDLGTFPTSESAFQVQKSPNDKDYIEKQKTAKNPAYSKIIGRHCKLREDWNEVRDKIMYKVVWYKFQQHPDIKQVLINSGLRPLYEHTHNDSYWGDGGDGSGQNKLGRILMKIREKLIL